MRSIVRNRIVLFFFFIACTAALGQTGTIAGLKRAISTEPSVRKKAVLLNELTWASYEAEEDSCSAIAQKALSYALRHRQWEQQLVARLQLAETERSEDHPELAAAELQRAQQLLNRHNAARYLPRLLLFKGNLAYGRSDLKKAARCYRKGYRLSRMYHQDLQVDLCLTLARMEQQKGAVGMARKHLREACSVAHERKNPHLELLAWNNLGNNYAMAQELDRAQTCFMRSLHLAEQHNDAQGKSRACLNIGNVAYYKGNWTEAVAYYVRSARIKESLDDRAGIAMIHNNIAAIYKEQKRYGKSLAYYGKTSAYYAAAGDSVALAETWVNTAIVEIFSGKHAAGVALLHRALHLLDHRNLPDIVLIAHTNLAFAYTETGQYERSLHYLALAERAADSLHDQHSMAFITNLYGADYFFLKDTQKAIRYYTRSYELSRDLGLLNEQKKALFGLYEAEQKRGNYEQALSWHERYTHVTDSLFNRENQRTLAELQEKYDSRQKEQKITDLSVRNTTISLESRLMANQLNSSLLGGALVLLAIVFLSWLFYQRSKRQRLLLRHTQERNKESIDQLLREQELATLETAVIAQQEERKKLAKDLHDNLGSYLATLKYQHEATSPAGENPGALAQHATTSQLIAEACSEVRNLSHQMATGAERDFSLVPAIRELIDRIHTTGQFTIDFFHSQDVLHLPHEAEWTVYKIIQEMLSNVLKHAQATEVELQINQHADEITVLLADNGRGFDPHRLPSTGIGLANIRERTAQLNGRLEINSAVQQGTTIVLILPLHSSES